MEENCNNIDANPVFVILSRGEAASRRTHIADAALPQRCELSHPIMMRLNTSGCSTLGKCRALGISS